MRAAFRTNDLMMLRVVAANSLCPHPVCPGWPRWGQGGARVSRAPRESDGADVSGAAARGARSVFGVHDHALMIDLAR